MTLVRRSAAFCLALFVDSGHASRSLEASQHVEDGKCPLWCKTMDYWRMQSADGVANAIKAIADEKCVKRQCAGCVREKDSDLTTPHCVEPGERVVPVVQKILDIQFMAAAETEREDELVPQLEGHVCEYVETP